MRKHLRLPVRGAMFAPLAALVVSCPMLLAQQAPPPPTTPSATTQTPAPSSDTATPQSSAPRYTLHRSVSLVVLDGVALDAKGNVVTDLNRSDFHIVEDGTEQTIRAFEKPGAVTVPAEAKIESTADLDRQAPRVPVNIVLLDEFSTRFEDMAFGRYSLKKWLDRQPGKLSSPTMLVAVDLQKFTVLRDYTQDKGEILKALDHHFATYPWQTHNGGWIAERYATAFNTLARVADATSGHVGHKNMIWIGRGFPTINFQDYPPEAQQVIDDAIQSAISKLRESRVTLYTIDPAGLMVDPGKYGQDADDFDPFGGDADFEGIARATGGRSLHGRNDVDVQIGTAIQDNANLYTLSYSPLNATTDNPSQFRHVKVVVDRPGVTFLTRLGYFPSTGPDRLNEEGKADAQMVGELANAANSNMNYDGVHIAVRVTSDPNKVNFLVPNATVGGSSDGPEPQKAQLIIAGSLFDKKGKEIGGTIRKFTFAIPANTNPNVRVAANVRSTFEFPKVPGAVRGRLVIRINDSGRMGTVDFALTPGTTAANGDFPISFP